jgi:hypothetical protein
MRATGIGNLGNKHIRYTPDMILTFLLAHANYNLWEEKKAFIVERHPELKDLTRKNFEEQGRKNGWYKTAMKMKNDALAIAEEEAKERKAEVTRVALNGELEMAESLEEERSKIISSLRAMDVGSKEYGAAIAALDRVTGMIERIGDTGRMRKRQDLADSAEAKIYVASKLGEMKNQNPALEIPTESSIITEDDNAFEI